MGLQTWQYLLGITYANSDNQSYYSSDFQYNQPLSLADSRQSLNSSASQNSLSEAQNEILSTIENHFKMLNDKLQKKEQMENYLGIIIGFTSLTSSFLISIPFSIIRNRSRALSLVKPNNVELIKFFNNFSEFPEGRLIVECCCESLLYQSCFTLTEDIINNVKDLMENPKDKKKEEKNKRMKKNNNNTSNNNNGHHHPPLKKNNKPVLIKTVVIKSIGFMISYPMYKSYICHPINYPKNMFQNYKSVFTSIKTKIVNNFIHEGFKAKTQGVIAKASSPSTMTQTQMNGSMMMINSPTSPYDPSYLERMPIIDTTRWYSKFFTTVFYWISYDIVERLVYKGITHFYFRSNNSSNKRGKELQRKPIPNGRQNSHSHNHNHNQNNDQQDQNGNSTGSLDENNFPPQSMQNSSSQEQSSNKEQRQNNGRSPQHAKVLKISTTMLKRVYIDVFCRLASSVITKVITYPIDTICVKLLTNGTEIQTNLQSITTSSIANTTATTAITLNSVDAISQPPSFPISENYPLLNTDIHGFWSCCKTIYQTEGILGFYEDFLYGMIPEILLNTMILEVTFYATTYLLKYVENKYEIIPKSKYRHRNKKRKNRK